MSPDDHRSPEEARQEAIEKARAREEEIRANEKELLPKWIADAEREKLLHIAQDNRYYAVPGNDEAIRVWFNDLDDELMHLEEELIAEGKTEQEMLDISEQCQTIAMKRFVVYALLTEEWLDFTIIEAMARNGEIHVLKNIPPSTLLNEYVNAVSWARQLGFLLRVT
jgi:hypothetical protein